MAGLKKKNTFKNIFKILSLMTVPSIYIFETIYGGEIYECST